MHQDLQHQSVVKKNCKSGASGNNKELLRNRKNLTFLTHITSKETAIVLTLFFVQAVTIISLRAVHQATHLSSLRANPVTIKLTWHLQTRKHKKQRILLSIQISKDQMIRKNFKCKKALLILTIPKLSTSTNFSIHTINPKD